MFQFNLKPGHANLADGLLDSPGTFGLTVNLVPGHSATADGLLVGHYYFQQSSASEPVSEITGEGALSGQPQTQSASGLETIPGSSSLTASVQTLQSVGNEIIAGLSALNYAAQTSSASGVETIFGAGELSSTVYSLAATGSNGEEPTEITGEGALQTAALECWAAGRVVIESFTGNVSFAIRKAQEQVKVSGAMAATQSPLRAFAIGEYAAPVLIGGGVAFAARALITSNGSHSTEDMDMSLITALLEL